MVGVELARAWRQADQLERAVGRALGLDERIRDDSDDRVGGVHFLKGTSDPNACPLDRYAAIILDHDIGIERASHEVECLGLSLLRQNPLTIHFPGRTRTGSVVFCWQEGEDSVCHGHAVGEEEEPRRPLKVRIIDTHKH